MGKSAGLSSDVQSGMLQNQNALVQLAQQQASRSGQLFNATFPGLQSAEQFYGSLASGSPYAISTATAPAVAQIAAATQGAKQNILNNAPAGGEKNLAIEQADVNQGAEVGKTATSAFLGAPNALASLAGQGVGESISSAGTAIGGYNSANNALGNLGNLQIQQKGAQLGALTSLGSDAATLGAAFI